MSSSQQYYTGNFFQLKTTPAKWQRKLLSMSPSVQEPSNKVQLCNFNHTGSHRQQYRSPSLFTYVTFQNLHHTTFRWNQACSTCEQPLEMNTKCAHVAHQTLCWSNIVEQIFSKWAYWKKKQISLFSFIHKRRSNTQRSCVEQSTPAVCGMRSEFAYIYSLRSFESAKLKTIPH